jgi:hypothetical protein
MAIDTDNDNDVDLEKGERLSLQLSERDVDTPSDSYVPEGFDTVEDYLKDLRETYKLDLQADDDNRVAAMEDKKFTAGEQWDPQVLLQRQGLPCLKINTIPQFTAQLVGDWRENKISVKVLPAEGGDKDTADVRADLIRSIETKARAQRVYNNAFESMVQCGDGAFRVSVKYCGDDVFDQDITVSPIDDALSVVWDRMSTDITGRDANHCFVDDMIPENEFKTRWKDADPSLLSKGDKNMLSAEGWIDNKLVRVTEHWRLIERPKTLILFKDGTMYPIDSEKSAIDPKVVDAFIEKHGDVVKMRNAPCTYAQMHLVTGYKILAGPYEWKLDRLPIIRMMGRVTVVGDRRVRYGLVRDMKDPIRYRNFVRSVAAEQLGYAPKAQWIAPESAVEGREDAFRKAHLTRDPLLIYNDDAEAPPEKIEPPTIQTALLNEAMVVTQDIKDVTGIHDASLGIKSNETSGKAIQARQREGDVSALTYYDNGNAAVLEAGDVINQLIPQIYDGTRIVRIIGEDESTKLVSINDPMDPNSPNLATGKYDVAISTGASYTTRRAEAGEAMMNAIQVWPQLMGVAGDLVVKAQDWPGAEELADRLIKTIPPALLSDKEKQEVGNQPDMNAIMQQQAQQGEQLQNAMKELQKLQQENLMLKTKAAAEEQKAEIEKFKAETDRLVAYADIIKAGDEANLRQLEIQAEQADSIHGRIMDVANMAKDTEQFNQQQELANRQQDADEAQASSDEKASTQPSE